MTQTVLITGASSGIGKAAATLFADPDGTSWPPCATPTTVWAWPIGTTFS